MSRPRGLGSEAAAGLAVVAALGLACGNRDPFLCSTDLQCEHEGAPGFCEAEGYCSFEDAECASGRRYGEFASDGLVGECVPVGATTTATDGTTSTTGGPGESTTSVGVVTGDSGVDESSGSTGEPVDPDLLLWLRFDDRSDPILDSSTFGWTLQCEPATCPQSAPIGVLDGAGTFDGATTTLALPYDPVSHTPDGLTATAWVRNDALDDLTIATVFSRPFGVGAENSWELYFRDDTGSGVTDLTFELGAATGPDVIVRLPDIAPLEPWIHVAVRWDGALASLWVDRRMVAEMPVGALDFDANPVLVGHDIDSGAAGNFLAGALDDVRLYRRALTAEEIAALP